MSGYRQLLRELAGYYDRRPTIDDRRNLNLAIQLDPTNASYHYQLGQQYHISHTTYYILDAIDEYTKSIELNPTNSQYHQSLALAYGALADSLIYRPDFYKKTHGEFETAISLEPKDSYRYHTYAIWLLEHPTGENIKIAVKMYRKVIEFNPKLTEVELAEEAIEKYYKSQKNYEKLIAILPGEKRSDIWFYNFLEKKEGIKYAANFAEKFLKTYSTNAELHFWIAHNSVYDGSFPWDFIEKHYEVAFKNDPRNGFYRLYHGIHLCFRKQYQAALKELEMSLTMDNSDEQLARKYIAKCNDGLVKQK